MREIVTQTIMELLSDPDERLELREEFKAKLQHSLEKVQSGAKLSPAHQVAARLAWSGEMH